MLVQYEPMTHKSGPSVLIGEAPTPKANGKRVERWKRKKGKPEVLSGLRQMISACIVKERGIGSGSAHNSSSIKVLQRSRRLSKNEMILKLGDGKAIIAEVVGSVELAISHHISGPLNTQTRDGYLYYIIFTDDHSQYGYVYLIRPASYKYLKVWGSPTYVKRLVGHKLDSRSSLYRRDAILLEESSEVSHETLETTSAPIVPADSVPVLRRSTRVTNHLRVDPPKGIKPVGYKLVYKYKLGADGDVTTFKARPVAKGYIQRLGVDFEETYSPVKMAKSIRILLVIVALYDYKIWQMDVKTGFLNGFVDQEIYIDQLEGFTSVGEEQKVCRLQRSIYGLKQASQNWNIRFEEVIWGYDFIKNESDPCVYKKISGSSVAYLLLYVDDILLCE
ncbi:UNVERIFIED_CONTAM: hypothetical protein Slati_0498100 [Sesamum latifolium]|uniref:Reverse transcriptase Ty1/copia-type domain-containing protein n=1 Tax=Sesamum latifolium TaxID=2727402 RepID=A0AAW2XXG5_9LAMI